MDTRDFEIFVGSVLRDFYNCDVWHVGRPGDDGIDLILIQKDEPLMIQVKRRTRPSPNEGINVVKLLFASAYGRARKGMVVTTAQRFTKSAQEWPRSPRLLESGFQLDLVDVNRLLSMINAVQMKDELPPWRAFLEIRLSLPPAEPETTLSGCTDGDVVIQRTKEKVSILVFRHDRLDSCQSASYCIGDVGAAERSFRIDQLESDVRRRVDEWLNSEVLGFTRHHGLDFIEILRDLDFDALSELCETWKSRHPVLCIDLLGEFEDV